MIINRIYEHRKFVTVGSFLPGRAKDLSAPLFTALVISFLAYLITSPQQVGFMAKNGQITANDVCENYRIEST
jgi:hypothetical protein